MQFVYGDSSTIEPKLQVLLERRRAELAGQPNQWRGWTETDALLITYGDQLRRPSEAPLRSLKSFLDRTIAAVLSGVHILPFYPYSSDDGFSVIDYFAVDPNLGDWGDVQAMAEHFDLMFDAVFNHISARSEWFQGFLRDDPDWRDFFTVVDGNPDLSRVVRPRTLPLLTEVQTAAGPKKVWTTFSADQVDLNFRHPEVLLAVMDALLFYVAHGAKYIRLDAIAYLWKEIGTSCIHLPQTHAIIRLMKAILEAAAPDVRLVTETNVPHADNISYFGNGRDEAQMVYNFALPPLVLHTLSTGNASALSKWAAELTTPSPEAVFFNFLASHDGVGVNPVRGILPPTDIDALVSRVQAHGGFVSYKRNPDGSQSPYELNINYFDALSNPNDSSVPIERQIDRFIVAQSIMLSLAGVPGIYFHSLFGSRNDRAGAESSGIPRRINRQKFDADVFEAELANPASLRARVFARFRQLLRARGSSSAFNPTGGQRVLAAEPRVFAVERRSPDGTQRVLCLHNVSDEPVRFELGAAELGTSWRSLTGAEVTRSGSVVSLGPYEVQWLESIG